MPLFDVKNVTLADLQSLIDEQVFENKELEYKDYSFLNGKLPPQTKDKFPKEIAAFANTNGGIIIIGMKEDDNRLPTEITGTGMSLADFDEWLSSFRQVILSRIRPHLHGVECKPVKLDDTNIAIVISVPKSYSRPHSVWDGNKDEFFMRYANGVAYMDIDDLRREFLYSSVTQEKIRNFRRDRYAMILANECIGDLGNGGKLVFHIIPEWSFELGNSIDLTRLERRDFRPLTGSSWNHRFNADGYCLYSTPDYRSNQIKTYTQFFHNGIVEATEIRLISNYQHQVVYDWRPLQDALIKSLKGYGGHLEYCGVPKPWHITGAFLNVRGYVTTAWGGTSEPIDRDIVISQEGICTDEVSMESAMKPVFDSLSNAFGLGFSSYFYQS